MSKTPLRLIFSVLVLCAAAIATAAGPGAPPPSPDRLATYVMLLKDVRDLPDNARKPGEPAEPDIAKAGGKELARWGTRRVIRIPIAALEALSKHSAVIYLGLINTGEGELGPRVIEGAGSRSSLGANAVTGPPQWQSGGYIYDGSGNVIQIGFDKYFYDGMQRLKAEETSGGRIDYGYDGFGNRETVTVYQQPPIPYAVDHTNNHLLNVSYDEAGNQRTAIYGSETYAWDAGGSMTERWRTPGSQSHVRYLYSADDERVGKEDEVGGWEWTLRDVDGKVLISYKSIDATDSTYWFWKEDYFYHDGQLTAADRLPSEGRRRFFHLDHLGTPRLITNGAGQRIAIHDYYAFGMEQTAPNAEYTTWGTPVTPMAFTGHERDFGNVTDPNVDKYLDYMHARYYNSVVGRFLSVDPVMDLKRTLRNPQMWNPYSYVVNNPMRYTDPDGREHVNEPGFTKPYSEWHDAMEFDENTPAVIKAAFYAEGGLFALAGGVAAYEALETVALHAMVRLGTWGGGGAVTAEGLRRAASEGGPTTTVVTNLTRAPQEGRTLYAASGEGAQAVANAARSGAGVRTFVAQIPQALLRGLQDAKLVEVSRLMQQGSDKVVTQYRFAPGATEYILKFFKELQ